MATSLGKIARAEIVDVSTQLHCGGASDGVRTGRGAWLRACACAPNGVRGRVRKIGGTSISWALARSRQCTWWGARSEGGQWMMTHPKGAYAD